MVPRISRSWSDTQRRASSLKAERMSGPEQELRKRRTEPQPVLTCDEGDMGRLFQEPLHGERLLAGERRCRWNMVRMRIALSEEDRSEAREPPSRTWRSRSVYQP